MMHKGFSLIEIVIGGAILTTFIIGGLSVYNYFLLSSLQGGKKIEATLLLEEGVEAARFLRDDSWSKNIAPFSSNTAVFISTTTTGFSTSTTGRYIHATYWREMRFIDVFRDAQGKVQSTGTLDANTKEVRATVSWRENNATTSITLSTYLSNIFSN